MKIYAQETNKSCGVACIRSAINHYGGNFSEKDIWEKTKPFTSENTGILNPILNMGITALKFGFDVTYIGYEPTITQNNSSEDLLKSLKQKSKTYYGYGKFIIDNSLEFIKLGGKIKIDIPNIEKIKKIVDKNKFIIVEVSPIFLNKNATNRNMRHKIIINGYTKTSFKVLDPSKARKYNLNFDKFLLAFYSANPELLIIKPKKNYIRNLTNCPIAPA